MPGRLRPSTGRLLRIGTGFKKGRPGIVREKKSPLMKIVKDKTSRMACSANLPNK
jgi:hypothetical protein